MPDNDKNKKAREDVLRRVEAPCLIRAEAADGDTGVRTLRLTAATDAFVRMWDGWESLTLTEGAVDTSEFRYLMSSHRDHDADRIMGAIQSVTFGDGRMDVEVTVDPVGNARGERLLRLLEQGAEVPVSLGYQRAADPEPAGMIAGEPAFVTPRIKAIEVSQVVRGADPNAAVLRTSDQLKQQQRGEAMPDEQREQREGQDPQREGEQREGERITVAQVRENNAEILRIGDEYEKRGVAGAKAKAEAALREGRDVGWLRGEVQALMDARFDELQADSEKRTRDMEVGLSAKENEEFSLLRLFRYLHRRSPADEESARLEIDACTEARKINQTVPGISSQSDLSLPAEFFRQPIARTHDDARWIAGRKARRAAINVGGLGVAATQGADSLVATELLASSFVEYLYNESILLPRVRNLPGLMGNVDVPRQIGAMDPSWQPESRNDDGPHSEPSFDEINLSPKKLYAESWASHTALLQTAPAMEGLLRADIAEQIALKIDVGGINGSGANNQPTGFANAADINKITGNDVNGIEPTRGMCLALGQAVAAANAIFDDSMWFCDWRLRFKLMSIEIANNTGKFLWGDDDRVISFPTAVSNNMPTAARGNTAAPGTSTLAFLSPSQIFHGVWGTPDIMLDPLTQRRKGYVAISVIEHHDFQVYRPKAVAVRPFVKNALA